MQAINLPRGERFQEPSGRPGRRFRGRHQRRPHGCNRSDPTTAGRARRPAPGGGPPALRGDAERGGAARRRLDGPRRRVRGRRLPGVRPLPALLRPGLRFPDRLRPDRHLRRPSTGLAEFREGDMHVLARDRILSGRRSDTALCDICAAQDAMAGGDVVAIERYAVLEDRLSVLGGYGAEAEAASPASATSWTPSGPPPAMGTWTGSWRCWARRSRSGRTPPQSAWARHRR